MLLWLLSVLLCQLLTLVLIPAIRVVELLSPFFDMSNTSLGFLPTEEQLCQYWDTIVSVGEPKVESLKNH